MSAGLWPSGTPRGRKRSNIYRALSKAGYPTIKEPQGLLRSDGKRPDGITLIPWKAGKSLVWDAMVIDTLAPSYLTASAAQSGAAAAIAEDRKMQKYHAFLQDHVFIPQALETMGPINTAGLNFISDLGCHLTLATGEQRDTTYLFQRLSITMQRFNAVAFRVSFNKSTPDKDDNDI